MMFKVMFKVTTSLHFSKKGKGKVLVASEVEDREHASLDRQDWTRLRLALIRYSYISAQGTVVERYK